MSIDIDIPAIPTTPEESICASLEIYLKWVDAVLAAGLAVPYNTSELLRNAIRTQTDKVYSEVLTAIEEIEESLKSLCKALEKKPKPDEPSDDQQWCKTLFACKAFMSLILNEKVRSSTVSLIPMVPDDVRSSLSSDYDTFVRYICNFSLSQILYGLSMSASDMVLDKVEPLITMLRKTPRIDSLLDEYFSQINGLGVFELLDMFLEFEKCVFTACDMKSKTKSKLQEVRDKLFITGDEPGEWTIDWSIDWIARSMTKETEVRRRLAVLENIVKSSQEEGYDICSAVRGLKGKPKG